MPPVLEDSALGHLSPLHSTSSHSTTSPITTTCAAEPPTPSSSSGHYHLIRTRVISAPTTTVSAMSSPRPSTSSSYRSSMSPRLNATLNIKGMGNETIESIPLSPDGSYTFTSTLPLPSSPSFSSTSASSSSSSSSSSYASGATVRKVTTIRAPKKSPIIINLNSGSADPASFSSTTTTLSSSSLLSSLPVNDLPSPRPVSPSLSSSSSTSLHSPSAPPALSPFSLNRFSATVPLKPVDSLVRHEMAKEVRARIAAQQQQREDYAAHRQQREASQAETRKWKAEVDSLTHQLTEEREAHFLTRQQLMALTTQLEEAKAELSRTQRAKDSEHSELLSQWERSLSTWEKEKEEWSRVRHDMTQQQTIADLAVSALQSEQTTLQAQVDSLTREKAAMESHWSATEGRVSDAVEEAKVWHVVLEEERRKTSQVTSQLEQLKESYHALLITHLHKTEEAAQQPETADPAAAEGPRVRINLGRPSLFSPLLSPVEQVQSHVNDEHVEAKYADHAHEAVAPPIDEQITAAIIEQAAQAQAQLQEEMKAANERLRQSHADLHNHVRQISQSHEDTQQRLQAELDAYRTQCAELMRASTASEKRVTSLLTKHKAVWKQLGSSMNSHAALKGDHLRLERETKEQYSRHQETITTLQRELSVKEKAVQQGTAVYMDYLARLTQAQKELAAAQEQLQEQGGTIHQSNATISDLTLQLQRSREEAAHAKTRLEELQGELEWAKLASNHSSQSFSSLQLSTASTVRQWQSEKRVWAAEKESFVAEREHLHVHLQQAQESREELTEQLQDVRAREDRLERDVAHLRAESSESVSRLVLAHQKVQEQWEFLQEVKARVQSYVDEQTAVRGKLGNLIAAEKRVTKEYKRTATSLRVTVREREAVLVKMEKRWVVAEENSSNLQRERDEFDVVLHGALVELQLKEQQLGEAHQAIERARSDRAGVIASAQSREFELNERIEKGVKDSAELHSVLVDAIAELKRREAEKVEANAEAESSEEAITDLRRRNEEMRGVMEQMIKALNTLEAQCRQDMEDNAGLTARVREYREVYEDAVVELKKREEQLKEAAAEAEELRDQVAAVKRGKAEVSEVLHEATAALRAIEEAHQRALSDNEDLNGLIAKHERLHDNNDETIQRLYDERDSHIQREETLSAEAAHLRALCESQQAAIAQVTSIKDQLADLVDRLMKGTDARVREVEARAEQLKEVEAELHTSLMLQLSKAHTELVQVEAERLANAAAIPPLTQQLQESERRLGESQGRLAKVEAEERRLKAEVEAVREARDAGTKEFLEVRAARLLLEGQNAALQAEVAELTETLRKAEAVQQELLALQQSREALIETLLQQCNDVQTSREAERVQRAEEVANQAVLTEALKAKVAHLSQSLEESELHLHQAMEDLDHMTAQCKLHQSRLTEAASQNSDQQDRIARLTKDKAELDEVLRDAWTTLVRAEKVAAEGQATVQQEKTHMGAVIEQMRGRVHEGHRSINELSSVLREVLLTLKTAEAERATAIAQVEALTAEQSRLIEAGQKAVTDSLAVQTKLGEAREQLRDSRTRQGEDAQEIASQTEEIGRLRSEAEELHHTLEAAQQAIEDAQTEVAHAEQRVEEVKEELSDTKAKLDAAEAKANAAAQGEEARHHTVRELEEMVRALHLTLNDSQQEVDRVQGELQDALKMRRITQEQLEQNQQTQGARDEMISQAQHQIALLTESLTAASQAAEDYAAQLTQRDVSADGRVRELEAQLVSRSVEVKGLQASLQSLEDEFARHNADDHAEMEEQSKRWQEDQDRLHADIAQLKAANQQQLNDLTAQRDQAKQAVQESEKRLRAVTSQVQAGEAQVKALKVKEKELVQCQEQLRISIVQHEEVVRRLESNESTAAADQAKAAKAAKAHTAALATKDKEVQAQATALAAKDKEVQSLTERVESLQSEVVHLHTHNGGSTDVVLNAVIEAQAATIESQLTIPHSPTTPSSRSAKAGAVAVAGKEVKMDPMAKVLAANHKKEVSLLKAQLDKAMAERRVLEKKVKDLEKARTSLSSLKAQAEYRSKDIIEQGRSWEQKVAAMEATVADLNKDKGNLSSTINELTTQVHLSQLALERAHASDREKEEKAAVNTAKWVEERQRLEQRIAALQGKMGVRRRKSSSSVTFRDDSALHVGDLRNEIVDLKEENEKLVTTIGLLTSHRVEEGNEGEREEEEEDGEYEEDDQVEEGEEAHASVEEKVEENGGVSEGNAEEVRESVEHSVSSVSVSVTMERVCVTTESVSQSQYEEVEEVERVMTEETTTEESSS